MLAIAAVAAGCGGSASDSTRAKDVAAKRHFRFFAANSVWNRPADSRVPLDPRSRQIVAALAAEVGREQEDHSGPWINTTKYSVPILRVPVGAPTTKVKLTSSYAAPGLRRAFAAVPLPPDAQPSPGNDAHLVVWQPGRDRLWEFWHLARTPTGWQAEWGGAIADVSTSSGVYSRSAWPGASPLWGASASSLSIAGGVITLEDLNRGRINHALMMSLPAVRAGVYALPARRTDGTSPDRLTLPEGAHLRLPPGLDLEKLKLPPLTRMIARAAQRYGIVIRDTARNVTFNAQAPRSPARDPYSGPAGYFGGLTPRELLASFPWERLQLLPMRLRRFKRTGDPAG